MMLELPMHTVASPTAFGVEIHDLSPDRLSDADVAEIRDLVQRRRLVVFRDLALAEADYLAFARRFGTPQVYHQQHYHHPRYPEIFVSSNVPEDGQKVGVAGTGKFWHTDYSFFEEPLSTTMVQPKVVPDGHRATYFIDMVEVLAALPDDLRAPLTAGRRGFHDATNYYKVQPWDIDRPIIDLIEQFRRTSPGAWHPLVIEHPVTGEHSLYVSEGFTTKIEGMSHEECAEYLPRLFEFVRRPEHIRQHPWRRGDILYWDNRTLIHRASDNAENLPSVSHRVGVYESLPFYKGHVRGEPHVL